MGNESKNSDVIAEGYLVVSAEFIFMQNNKKIKKHIFEKLKQWMEI